MKKTLIVSLIVSAVVAFLVAGARLPSSTLGGLVHNVTEDFTQGISVSGTTVIDSSGNYTNPVGGDLRGQLVQTGTVTSIASGSVHYTASQLCNSTVIRHNVHGVGVTASNSADVFPTAAALVADCVPTAGDTKLFVLQNTSDDAAERVTPTANTGLDFFIASGSASTIDRKDTFIVRYWNVNGTSVSFSFEKVEDTN